MSTVDGLGGAGITVLSQPNRANVLQAGQVGSPQRHRMRISSTSSHVSQSSMLCMIAKCLMPLSSAMVKRCDWQFEQYQPRTWKHPILLFSVEPCSRSRIMLFGNRSVIYPRRFTWEPSSKGSRQAFIPEVDIDHLART